MAPTPTSDTLISSPPLPAMRFIMHFGEMGSRWGINRTVGQMYALLYLSPKPLCADDMVAMLSFSRSNISMGIKELESLKLIQLIHLPGDRRDYFKTPDDVWEVAMTLVEERRQREIQPTLTLLRDLLLDAPSSDYEVHAHKKMTDMYELITLLTDWYQDMRDVDKARLITLLKLGKKVFKFYDFTDRMKSMLKGDNKNDQDDNIDHKDSL